MNAFVGAIPRGANAYSLPRKILRQALPDKSDRLQSQPSLGTQPKTQCSFRRHLLSPNLASLNAFRPKLSVPPYPDRRKRTFRPRRCWAGTRARNRHGGMRAPCRVIVNVGSVTLRSMWRRFGPSQGRFGVLRGVDSWPVRCRHGVGLRSIRGRSWNGCGWIERRCFVDSGVDLGRYGLCLTGGQIERAASNNGGGGGQKRPSVGPGLLISIPGEAWAHREPPESTSSRRTMQVAPSLARCREGPFHHNQAIPGTDSSEHR